jgi:hypothetical protein
MTLAQLACHATALLTSGMLSGGHDNHPSSQTACHLSGIVGCRLMTLLTTSSSTAQGRFTLATILRPTTVIQWYGVGSAFVNADLPMYLALKSKPNNGGKIQNLANVASGIVLHLKVVKLAKEEKAISTNAAAANKDKDNGNNNTNKKGGKSIWDLMDLTELWHHSGRIITTNMYFASVEVAIKMKEKGLFIGNIKQCSRRFLMEVLWECHPCKARIVIGPCVNRQQDRQDRTCCHELGQLEPLLFIPTTFGIGKGKQSRAIACAS